MIISSPIIMFYIRMCLFDTTHYRFALTKANIRTGKSCCGNFFYLSSRTTLYPAAAKQRLSWSERSRDAHVLLIEDKPALETFSFTMI